MLENEYKSSLEILAQTGTQTYLQNQEALSDLKKLQSFCNATIAIGGGLLAAGAFLNPSQSFDLTVNELVKLVDRLVSVIEDLLKIEGIIVTPRIMADKGTIDLLVKMPDRRRFAFLLRSRLNSRIKWVKQEQNIIIITPVKGRAPRVKRWPELREAGKYLNDSVISLSRKKNHLLGASGTERNLPVVKAIILTSNTQIDPTNDLDLFTDFGTTRVLRVPLGCSIYVLKQCDLEKFLQKA